MQTRKDHRLKDFDYSSSGTYYITICTKEKKNLFGNIVNQLKGYVSKKVGFPVWQKLYYDHIIRDQEDYDTKWNYIENNPMTWCERHGELGVEEL